MLRTRALVVPFLLSLCAFTLPAAEAPWTDAQIRQAVMSALDADASLAAVQLNAIQVEDSRVTLDLSHQLLDLARPAAIDRAVRRLATAIAAVPADADRFELVILIDGAPMHTARGLSAGKFAARRAAVQAEDAPAAPAIVLNPDTGDLDPAGTRSAELAMTIREALSSGGLEVLGARNLDKQAGIGASGLEKWQESALPYLEEIGVPEEVTSQGDEAARPLFANWAGASALLTLRAAGSATPLVYYSSDHPEAAALALAFQAHLPGSKVIACADCGQELTLATSPSLIVDPAVSTDDPVAQLRTAGAVRDTLLAATATPRAASKAEMTSPAPGTQLTGAAATFQWNAGQDATSYYLMVGTWLGGNTLYSQSLGTLTSASVTGLPTNGVTLYVRLWSYINDQWVSNDYQYRAYSPNGSTPARADLTQPAAGSKLSGAAATFQWTAGVGVQRYYLFLGQWAGGNTLGSVDAGTGTQTSVTNLPTDGSSIYVRLWSYIDGVWQYNDYTLEAAGTYAPAKAKMTSPAGGSALPGSTVTFQWDAGTGVTHYYLHVGTWQGGNTLYSQDLNTSQSAQVSGLPTDGSTVYVRLWSYISGAWQYNDYTYTAAGTAPTPVKAALTAPAPGSTLPGSTVTFTWSPGTAVQRYWLFLGTSAGNNDLYGADQNQNTAATVTVPANGKPVFVRLWSYINGAWQYNDYTFAAAGS